MLKKILDNEQSKNLSFKKKMEQRPSSQNSDRAARWQWQQKFTGNEDWKMYTETALQDNISRKEKIHLEKVEIDWVQKLIDSGYSK